MDDSRVEKHAQIDPARASMIPLSELKYKLVCTIVACIMAWYYGYKVSKEGYKLDIFLNNYQHTQMKLYFAIDIF